VVPPAAAPVITSPSGLPGVEIGMKLEALDIKTPGYICVATIIQIQGENVRISFDGWSENFDYWCRFDHPNLAEPHTCRSLGHFLQPPRGYGAPQSFNWEIYLVETAALPYPNFHPERSSFPQVADWSQTLDGTWPAVMPAATPAAAPAPILEQSLRQSIVIPDVSPLTEEEKFEYQSRGLLNWLENDMPVGMIEREFLPRFVALFPHLTPGLRNELTEWYSTVAPVVQALIEQAGKEIRAAWQAASGGEATTTPEAATKSRLTMLRRFHAILQYIRGLIMADRASLTCSLNPGETTPSARLPFKPSSTGFSSDGLLRSR
jgi:hypothetical protein